MSNTLPKKLTKYEKVICSSIIAHNLYFNMPEGGNYNWNEITKKIIEEDGFNGDEIVAKFIIDAISEKQGGRETVPFLPDNVKNEMDPNADKFFTLPNDKAGTNNAEELGTENLAVINEESDEESAIESDEESDIE